MPAADDPVLLIAEILAAQQELGRHVDERGIRPTWIAPAQQIIVTQFAANLEVAWVSVERRPTHRRRCWTTDGAAVHARATRRSSEGIGERIIGAADRSPGTGDKKVLGSILL